MNGSPRPASGRTTLKEIARLAGVSVSTASLVLSGKSVERRISSDVEARVREIARRQDYSPNLLVRSLQRGRTHVLGFYSSFRHREPADLYMDRLVSAIERAAGARGYDLLLHSYYGRPVEEIYQFVNGGRTDGLLFFGPHRDDPLLQLLRASRLPTVTLMHADPTDTLSSVNDDVARAMDAVADTLVSLGHRRIGAITDDPNTTSDAALRIELLRRRLADHGLDLPEARIAPIYQSSPVSPEETLRAILSQPEPPTALFVWHDRVGYRVLEACERLEIVLPDRLSLIGYDGIHWPSLSKHVLASMVVDLEAMTATAVGLLDEWIQGNGVPPLHRSLPATLDVGTTLGPPG